MSEFNSIFESVREAAPPAIWSLGVELTRKATIAVESQTDKEIVLRVSAPGKPLSSTVKLWPEDGDWFCDCGRSTDACEHVAACVILLRKGIEALAEAAGKNRLRYDFVRNGRELELNRVLEIDGEYHPLLISWYHVRQKFGAAFTPSQMDASIDSLVADLRSRPLPRPILQKVLHLMKGSPHATLDGQPIPVAGEAAPNAIVIQDTGQGSVKVSAQPAPGVTEIFENGGTIKDGSLCPATEIPLSEATQRIFTSGRIYKPFEFTGLISHLLPELEEHYPILNQSTLLKLNQIEDMPRVMVQTSADRGELTIFPILVYGDPPYARVDGSSLSLIGNSKQIPKRQPDAEIRAAVAFRAKTGLSVAKRAVFRGDTALAMAERFADYRLGTVGEGLKLFSKSPSLHAHLTVTGNSFDVEFRVGLGDQKAVAREVLTAWQQGQDRVSLMGGGWANIPKAWLDKHAHTILDLLDSGAAKGKFTPFAKVEVARLCESLDEPCPADFTALRKSLDGFDTLPAAKLPPDLTAILRPYQRQGVDWLTYLKSLGLGALLADDMGLGKTLQTICALAKRSLVIAPTGLISNWEKEITRFRPKLKVAVHYGVNRELDDRADVTLTSYSLLRRDVKALSAVRWNTVVLDEAQNIKNPESQVAQAACQLDADFRVALSGTPVENRLEDLWSLFHFINPGLLGGLSAFKERDKSNLARKTKPFLLRRLKKEVAPELLPKTEIVLSVDLEETEKNLYDAIQAASRKEVLETLGKGGTVMAALECLLRMRQAACHPGLIPGQSAPDSSKFRVLREKLEEIVAEGHKALVFSQWTSLLDLLTPTLAQCGFPFLRIDGSTNAEARKQIVSDFQSETGPPLLMMTLKTGGVGLNLTAADHVFLVDPWWNPAAEDQAADRTHRIGQDKPVFVHRLISVGTVEEKILLLQAKKREAARLALEGSIAEGLTKQDLLDLLA